MQQLYLKQHRIELIESVPNGCAQNPTAPRMADRLSTFLRSSYVRATYPLLSWSYTRIGYVKDDFNFFSQKQSKIIFLSTTNAARIMPNKKKSSKKQAGFSADTKSGNASKKKKKKGGGG